MQFTFDIRAEEVLFLTCLFTFVVSSVLAGGGLSVVMQLIPPTEPHGVFGELTQVPVSGEDQRKAA